ncbi:MAG TPA: ankyrin repeat domain-containing protein [Gammaproteobacteria bacterium]|nr:ankyrin repeat domain-containing protein [Gammaproteobacteria bacterium]
MATEKLVKAVFMAALAVAASQAYAAAPVADAVMHRDAAALHALLAQHADVNAAQSDGATALHWAAYLDDLGAAQALIEAGAKVEVANREGMTPLFLACQAGDAAMVMLLLDNGADAAATLRHGETTLMMAARTGKPAVLKELLAHGAAIDAKEKLRGTTALMWAAAYSNPAAVEFLVEHGADVAARSNPTVLAHSTRVAPTARSRIESYRKRLAKAEQSKQASDAGDDDSASRPRARSRRQTPRDRGGLTPLVFAVRQGDMDSVRILIEHGAAINQTTEYGWTPLLAATENRYYRMGRYLLEHGADPNIANKGGWTPLYIATDNRNVAPGDYPVRKPDMDHLDFIGLLLKAGADPNARMRSSIFSRTVFTNPWLYEDGATPFLRAAESGDLVLMKTLLEHGADPHIPTDANVTPLMVASGIGWVDGLTYEWSPEQTLATVKFLLDLGADVNAQDTVDGRTALMGAAHKGRNGVVQLLVDHGADLSVRDIGSRDSINALAGVTWQAIDYADGLVRVGVQSAVAHPKTAALIRKLMTVRGLAVPPAGRTLKSICVTEICKHPL